jgi:hypothetical protein
MLIVNFGIQIFITEPSEGLLPGVLRHYMVMRFGVGD